MISRPWNSQKSRSELLMLRGRNPLTVGFREPRVGNLPILIRRPQDGIQRAEFPADQVLGSPHVHLVAAGQGREKEIVEPAFEVARQCGAV